MVYNCGMSDAVVIFEDNNLHPLSFLMRRGFRHVWVAVVDENAGYWVAHDVRLTGHATTVLADASFDLAAHYRAQGCTVVVVQRRDRRILGPVLFNSCVGLTKHLIGLRSFALTPRQLHRALTETPRMKKLLSFLSRLMIPAGLGGGGSQAVRPPPPPAAPRPTPTPVEVAGSNVAAQYRQRQRQQAGVAGSIRNTGGMGGSLVQMFQMASRNLTGQ